MHKSLRWLLLSSGLMLLLMTAAVGWVGDGRNAPTLPPLPVPNGRDLFMQAAATLSKAVPAEAPYDRRVLKAEVEANREALDFIHTGLRQRCQVPLQPTKDFLYQHAAKLGKLMEASHLLGLEAALAGRTGRPSDQLRSILDGIRYGHECARGGIIIDGLFGLAIETRFLNELTNLLPGLSLPHCRIALASLEAIHQAAEPAAAAIKTEKELWLRVSPLRYRILSMQETFQPGTFTANHRYYDKNHAAQVKKRCDLLLALATRCFELEHEGRRPIPADLVPGYLKETPQP